MIIDTSAVVAIALGEVGHKRLLDALAADPLHLISAATLVECALVLEGRYGQTGREALDRLVADLDIDVVVVDGEQAEAAREAFRRFGKGRHPAALNFGDCFAYALAKTTGEPLLCTGTDFQRTDLTLC